MNIICPNCKQQRSTDKPIGPGTKVRCPGCKQVFIPILADEPILVLEVQPDPEPPPPARLGAVAPPIEEKPLHGRRFNPLEASRRGLAVALSLAVLGSLGVFINWYAHTVKTLDVTARRAAQKRASQVEKLSSHKAIQLAPRVAPNFLLKPYSPELLQQARPDAKAEYEGIISRYPETDQAKTAKEKLAALGEKTRRWKSKAPASYGASG
jgi:hypothetical protein